jgi:hypothetical protein
MSGVFEDHDDFYYTEPLPGGGHAHILKLQGHEIILMHRRRNYRAYNETPTEGTPVKNTWLRKKMLEALVGAPFALAIGYLIKMEKIAVDRAKEHYFPEDQKSEEQND